MENDKNTSSIGSLLSTEILKSALGGTMAMNPIEKIFNTASRILGIVVLTIGVTVIIGWIFDIALLKSIFRGMVSMKVNTALCFALVGLSLAFYHFLDSQKSTRRLIVRAFSLIIIFVGILTLYEYFSGHNIGIDELFFKDSNTLLTSSPGRMAVNTAFNFVLVGISIFLLSANVSLARDKAIQILNTFVFAIATLSLVGYAYGAHPLVIRPSFSTAMALHTTLAFLFISLALIYCTRFGVMRLTTDSGIVGKMLRRLVPVAFLTPVLFGFLKLKYTSSGLVANEMSVAFVALANVTFMTISILFFAKSLHTELQKKEALESSLKSAEIESSNMLKKKIEELERMNHFMISRELKMIELKKEITVLKNTQKT